MAHPTNESFKQMINGKTIDNCPIVASDIVNARAIFGPNRPGLQGKTIRQRSEQIEPEYLGIPRDFYRLHHFVTLTADVMFVNGLAFFTTLGSLAWNYCNLVTAGLSVIYGVITITKLITICYGLRQ